MKILVATDAWRPQVNGVVRTYERLADDVRAIGAEISIIAPHEFANFPCPTYPEVRLALPGYRYLRQRVDEISPDAVHIATEGPVGWMMRAYCLGRRIPYTTSFHTRFPDYLRARFGIPEGWTYAVQRRFHNFGAGMMVASDSLAKELEWRGFQRILPWTRGADIEVFQPRAVRMFGDGPVFLYVGRVAIEKNIDAFLDLDLPGAKVVVGDGPMLEELKSRHPDVTFTGRKIGEELANCYASADVFVFPSLTDTFGIVLLEAMASGVPVAAFPVTGPRDNVIDGVTGFLDRDLKKAALQALTLDRLKVRRHAETFSWENAARLFVSNIETAAFEAQGRRIPARRKAGVRRPATSPQRV